MMKSPILYLIFILVSLQFSKNTQAQQLPEILQQLLKADTSFNSLRCKINIHV